MATKKITLNELRSIVKQIIKEENSNDFLKFIKQTRLNYIHKWEKEIEKYEEHIKMYMNKSHLS